MVQFSKGMSSQNNPSSSFEKKYPPIPWGLSDETGEETENDDDDDDYLGNLLQQQQQKYHKKKQVLIYRKRSLQKKLRQLWIKQMEKIPDFPIQFVYDFQFNPVLKLCKTILRRPPSGRTSTKIQLNAVCTINENWSWKTSASCTNERLVPGTELLLDVNEKTLTVTKEWKIAPDPDQDVVASIRGCVDFSNPHDRCHWYLRAGLRVERVAITDDFCFRFCPQIPLDGKDGNIKFEPKINVDMPKLNVEYTTYRRDHVSFRNSDGFLEIGCKEQIFHFLF